MNKTDFIAEVSKRSQLSKNQANAAVGAALEVIAETVKAGGDVKLLGFGTFKCKEVPASEARNPATGATVAVPAHKTMKFAVGSELKRF